MFRAESEDTYRVLVSRLSTSLISTSILAATVLAITLYARDERGLLLHLFLYACFVLASLKILLVYLHSVAVSSGVEQPLYKVRVWEALHLASTLSIAASIGGVILFSFASGSHSLQLLSVALLFGYGSGLVSNLHSRPRIASASILLASMPAVFYMAFAGNSAHRLVAVLFLVFMMGGIVNIRQAYSALCDQIGFSIDMATLARNDPLTGLLNRLGIKESFRSLTTERSDKELIVCIYFDLNGFKPINDQRGHAIGDMLLCLIADRLRSLQGPRLIVGRLGGDEFVSFFRDSGAGEEGVAMAHEIRERMLKPYVIEGESLVIGLSMGYSSAPCLSVNMEELLASADEAQYQSKRKGGGITFCKRS